MPRLSFATRIGLIVVSSVAAVWLGGVALFFVSQSHGADGAQPLPTQIVAIVDLVERTPPAGQQAVLDAITSDTLRARVETGVQLGALSNPPYLRLGERHAGTLPGGARRSSAERHAARGVAALALAVGAET